MMNCGRSSRRRFFHKTAVAAASAAALNALPLARRVHAAGSDVIRIGLIGCGGRGTGAVLDALGAATKVIYPAAGYHTEDVQEGAVVKKEGVTIAALADLFGDRLNNCATQLSKLGIAIPAESRFTGFDAYKQLLSIREISYVILATPPHFRPLHLKAAIEAGKHVFMEKPVAVDVPGVRMVLDAGELAKQRGLGIAAGTQRRHAKSYQETIQRIRDGAIGELVSARCYWNGGGIWVVDRQAGWSDMEWQLRNWPYFSWLSGDHYLEQHVHNLDVMNWALGMHPVKAVSGIGGRQVRTGKQFGNIYDHFAVEYEYPSGLHMFSQARQINGSDAIIGEAVAGTRGASNCRDFIHPKAGSGWRFKGGETNPYCQEHADLIASIRAGQPINEARNVAESTMTGIIGREAAYSARAVEWDAAMKSTRRLGPEKYEWGAYAVPEPPMPGQYQFQE